MQEEIKCTEDGIEFGYKLTIAGTYIGDKDELINKDKVIQWHELYEADFTVKELS
jgi:surfactin synthase thioesterase subunit